MGKLSGESRYYVREFYDRQASHYGQGVETMFARLQKDICDNLAPHSGVAVDVGCGSGELLRSVGIGKPGLKLVGVDLSSAMLVELQSRAAGGNCLLIQGSVDAIPLPTGISRFTTCFGTLLFTDKWQALSELTRITEDGGWVLFDLPGGWNLQTRASFRIHRRNSIELSGNERLSQYRQKIERCNLRIENIVSLGVTDHWKGVPLLWKGKLIDRAMHTPLSSCGGIDLDLLMGRVPGLQRFAARWLFACSVRSKVG